jgi:4-amino-4-deoxy-L-arabinose transferase-like glycosyltransferase
MAIITSLRSNIGANLSQLLASPWVIVWVAAYLLVRLGSPPLFDLDEGAFSSATMEMLQRGDFITTYMGGELRFDKPILIYWLQALSVSALGLNEFALRLPSVICATAWCGALFIFVRQFLDASRAGTAVVFMACSLVFSVIARAATADALLNLFLALALFDSYRALTNVNNGAAKPRLRAYLWVGLGVLAKGPVAILIPFAVATLFTLNTRNWRAWSALMINPLGWAIAAAVFLPWYIAEYMAQGQAFIDGFILKHNVSRFSSTMEGHGGHWYYYLLISLLVFLPVTGNFLQIMLRTKGLLQDPFNRFCLCWFGFVLVFFSFSNTQLPHYLLYGATPIFILMARYREQFSNTLWVATPVIVFLILLLALPEIAQHTVATSQKVELVAMLQAGMIHLGSAYRSAIAAALVAVGAICFISSLPLWQRQLGISLVFTLVFIHTVLPTYGAIQQTPVRQAAEFARHLTAPLVMWRHDMPSFSVYLGKVVPIREPQPGDVVFTGIEQLIHIPHAEILFNQGGVALARINRPSESIMSEMKET